MADQLLAPPLCPKPHSRPPRRALGFTLVELIVVLVILGILAAVVTPRYSNIVDKVLNVAANTAAGEAIIRLQGATQLYAIDTGSPPRAISDLQPMRYLNLDASGKTSIGSYDAAYTYNEEAGEVTVTITSAGDPATLSTKTLPWP